MTDEELLAFEDFDCDLLEGFPGGEIGRELLIVGRCLPALSEHLSMVQDQYQLRASRQMEEARTKKTEMETLVEHAQILLTVSKIEDVTRQSLVISLWTVFESSVEKLADFAQRTTKGSMKFKDVRGVDFNDQAKKYFSSVIHCPLVFSKQEMDQLKAMLVIRNIFSHDAGDITRYSAEKKADIKNKLSRCDGIEINTWKVTITTKFVEDSYKCVRTGLTRNILTLRDFLEALCRKKNHTS